MRSLGQKDNYLQLTDTTITKVENKKPIRVSFSDVALINYSPIISSTGKTPSKANYLFRAGQVYARMRYITLFDQSHRPLMQIQSGNFWKDETEMVYNIITIARKHKIAIGDELTAQLRSKFPGLYE